MQKERETERGDGLLNRLVKRLRGSKRLELLVYAGIAALVLGLYLSGTGRFGRSAEKQSGKLTEQTAAETGQSTEERLKAVLSTIRGAGQVEVMITYETGKEIVTAMTTNTNTSSSESQNGGEASRSSQMNETSQPATYNSADGNEPIVLYEKEPTIRGVLVVAEGAADVTVRLDLQRAVRAVLDIPVSAIEIFERTGESSLNIG